ncbi:hypothetical protein KQI88_15920 [Alkaliphilus sp. MSJ-5]|uniref:Uncharacterized protein n=1 Tax=Alkaliphilus flagellatus TaxID=2841507 RepID=A0ABS6G5Y8_9FIRM|nr:hypothetical protein [Alkaliphilus flagellatus]MBU5677905.1 hypothetical protein [Alkaliphilus flagellatus]
MIKFKNKIDGSVFFVEPNTIQFTVLNNDSNYEVIEEELEEKKETTKKKAAK